MANITGNGQANTLVGTTASDKITGLAGDDWLMGEGGIDTIFGGLGNDVITLSGTSAQQGWWGSFAYGGDGDDLIVSHQLSSWGASINSGLGNNTVVGSLETWNAGDGDDLSHSDLSGVGGLTVVQGLNGSGTLVSGDGRLQDKFLYIQFFDLSADDDKITFSDDDRWKGVAPGAGADTIIGGTWFDDIFYGTQTGTGIDLDVLAGTLADPYGFTDQFSNVESFRATLDNDQMTATGVNFSVSFTGMAGDDTLRGGDADDTLSGDDGNDTMFGADGDDAVYGGAGDDVIDDGLGFDTVDGGDGFDTLVRSFAAVNLFNIVLGYDLQRGFNYLPNAPDDAVEQFLNLEAIVFSGDLTFILTGNGADNLLQSADGNDTLIGGDGADTLIGGGGKDLLVGGAGDDRLIGGAGADTFRFVSMGDVDTILGFVHDVDRIALSRSAFVGIGAGTKLTTDAFYSAVGAVAGHDGTDRVIYNKATGAVYFDADGNSAGGAVQIAQLGTLANHPTNITAADFLIF